MRKTRSRPDGKVLWPVQDIRLGRALVSIFPTEAEIDRGFINPPILTQDGTLSVYNAPLGVLFRLHIPPKKNLHSWFEEKKEYELLTFKGRGRDINKIVLGLTDEQGRAEEAISKAEAQYPDDSNFISLDIDMFRSMRWKLARSTGLLVSNRQLKSMKYIQYTECEIHADFMALKCPEAELYIRYRKAKRRGRVSSASVFAKMLELVRQTDV